MNCTLDIIIISMFNFLNLVTLVLLCKRISLVLGIVPLKVKCHDLHLLSHGTEDRYLDGWMDGWNKCDNMLTISKTR